MYTLIDRPVSCLDNGSRFLLWAMRAWVDSVARRMCPPGALAGAFSKMGALESLPHFHIFMVTLNQNNLEKLELAPMDHPHICEHEAVLLSLWHDVAANNPLHARAVLALMLKEDAVPVASGALRHAMGFLEGAYLVPGLKRPSGAN